MQDANWQLTAKGKRKTSMTDQGGTMTLEELAVHGLLDSEISRVSVATLCAADCCPSRFRESYARLRSFTSRVGTDDLSPLLFPVFSYVFLRLMECSFPQRAESFFVEFMGDHLEDRPRELSELAQLAQSGCVAGGGAVQLLDAYKSAVNLQPASVDKLCKFIEQSGDFFLLDFVRQRVSLDNMEQVCQEQGVVCEDEPVVNSESLESCAASSTSVQTGVLMNGSLDRRDPSPVSKEHCASIGCHGSSENSVGPVDGKLIGCKQDVKPLCNGLRDERCNKTVHISQETADEQTTKVVCSKHPRRLNGFQGSLERNRLFQLVSELRNSSACQPRVPSVCLYSVTDLRDGVGVMCSSRNVDVVCAGCDDSAIRLWKLSSQQSDQEEEANFEAGRTQKRNAERLILRGHSGPVYGCSFSPDDWLLASCGADRTIRLWDVCHSQEVSCATGGHDSPIWDVSFSRSEMLVASASRDTTAKLWVVDDSGGLQQVRMLVGHTADVDCVRFHPNSAYVATASTDHSVRLWDVCSGRMVRFLMGCTAPVRCLAFSPCGRFLACSGDDAIINIFELGSGQRVSWLQGHDDVVYTLAFSANGDVLASGGHDQQVRLWNAKDALEQNSTSVSFQPAAAASPPSPSPYQLACVPTKHTVPQSLAYLEQNLLFAFGASHDL